LSATARKETTTMGKRDIDQQIADLNRKKAARLAHGDARALLDQIKTALHEREYAVALVKGEALLLRQLGAGATQPEPTLPGQAS
jgi:hypothetical protein